MADIDLTSKEFWYKASIIIIPVFLFLFMTPMRSLIECNETSCHVYSQTVLGNNLRERIIARNNIKDVTLEYCANILTYRHKNREYRYCVTIKTKDGKSYYVTKPDIRTITKNKANQLSETLRTQKNIKTRI